MFEERSLHRAFRFMEHTIQLPYGHTDKDGQVHSEVTFGKRVTASDMLNLDTDPQAQSRTQYADLIRRKSIVKFGGLTMPPPLIVLLGLNKIDRDDLATGFEDFMRLSRGERTGELRPGNVVKLFFGITIKDVTYTLVTLDKLPTGHDEVAADAMGLGDGLAREMFMLGRMVSRISTEDDVPLTLDGPLDSEVFADLDGDDISLLRKGAQMAEAFFRVTRKLFRKQKMANRILALAKATGWSQSEILNLSRHRLNTYIKALNEINGG
jgi:hypothetical protein